GAHRKYYYRRLEDGSWSPWEQIKLDIEDNPVIPVVWKNQHGERLLLFWLKILKDSLDPEEQVSSAGPKYPQAENTGDEKSIATATLTEIKDNAHNDAKQNSQIVVRAVLCWSEYYIAKWQSTKTSDINSPVDLGKYDA